MKLLKAFAVFLLAFMVFSTTSCTSDFCSDEEVSEIKTELRVMLDNGTGTETYATPEGWSTKSETDKQSYIDNLYKTSHPKACLTIEEKQDPITGVTIEPKNFSFAISRGLIEGIFVFPIAWLMIKFTEFIGTGGWGQVMAIFIVTFLVRAFVTLITLKPSLASQKLTLLQPEISAINAKYGQTKDPVQKQKQAQEMMAFYKKNKVNPLTAIISPFLTLPIFIAVYGAVKDTMLRREGSVLGLNLGQTLSSGILSINIMAIIVFLAMIGSQFLAMKIPQLLNRNKISHMDEKARKAQNQTQSFTYVMLIMVVVVGWMLPSAMSVYWIASSLFSVLQAIIMKRIVDNKNARREY